MLRQFRHEMGMSEFVLKRDLFRLGKLPVNEFEEIETDGDTVDPDQIANVRDMVDVTIEGRFLLVRTNEHRVNPDHSIARADRFDLFVGDVAFDVVIFPRVRMRDDDRLRCYLDDVVEAGRTDVSEVDDDTEFFAFANDIAAKRRESAAWRTTRGEEPAIAGRIPPNMGQAK